MPSLLRSYTFLVSLLVLTGPAGDLFAEEAPDWVLEGTATWSPRDSQAEWVFHNQLWIGGGWFNSYEAPPRDLWCFSAGKDWVRVESLAPWQHSDLPMNLVFRDKMWMMGGWYNGRLPGHSAGNQVWSSEDGKAWALIAQQAEWSPRCAGVALAFRDQMWMVGGTENYYFGDENSIKNDVWSSIDGKKWVLACEQAEWRPRAYHQVVALDGRMYLLGGGNYVPDHFALNDVWSSSDGKVWKLETEFAAWPARIWFSAVTYRDRIWVLGGWSKENGNFGDVWHSADGQCWHQLKTAHCWKPRHEHSALVFNDKIWVLGGHADPLSNEVWSLSLPEQWNPE